MLFTDEGKFLDGTTFDQSEDFQFQIGFNRVTGIQTATILD